MEEVEAERKLIRCADVRARRRRERFQRRTGIFERGIQGAKRLLWFRCRFKLPNSAARWAGIPRLSINGRTRAMRSAISPGRRHQNSRIRCSS